MLSKRLISLILTVICLAGMTITPIVAADNAAEGSNNTVKSTSKPTQAPTEPPFTAENYGYAEYAKRIDKTVYNGELGAIYTPAYTTFHLWSPVASDVKVCIYKTGSDEEAGAQMLSSNPMKFAAQMGGWYLTLAGDYKNMYYTYQVTVNGETHEVVDPYAKAVGVNGNRGMIVDLSATDPDGWDEDSFARVKIGTDAVVWEVSVRDFSAAASSGVTEANRGKFLAFTETDTTLNGKEGDIATCVNYLKELGVNYVQINPFYDFASIDEADKESDQYNWGYDPKNYNVPEGSYSSNPYDGNVRIKECKQMIQALHNAGIGVIMDVVYNHTYYSDNSFFNQIVPDYYYRIAQNGEWSNGSGCGNDIATERYMVRRFIRDSVTYWAKEYHIDGFRFDLMGLMDVDTMNLIRASLDALPNGKQILMYGEAWNLSTASASDVVLANQDHMDQLSKRIGAFNDSGRDGIKGSTFSAREGGFVQSGVSKEGVRGTIEGTASGWAEMPNQVVNYVSCHDNLTLYDKLIRSVYDDEEYQARYEDLVEMNKLAAAITMTSRGMPFILAGEEFARTKNGDENSYQSSIEVNQLDWERMKLFPSLLDYYKGLIQIRSSLSVLRDSIGAAKIEYLTSDGGDCIAYHATMKGAPSVVVAFNGNSSEYSKVDLPSGKWVMIADGNCAGLTSLGEYKDTLELPHTTAAILVDASGFDKIGVSSVEARIYVRVTDPLENKTVYEEKYTGKMGESYSFSIPDDVLLHYNVPDAQKQQNGKFVKPFDVINIECVKYEGNYSSVTFRYLNEANEMIYNSIVISNRVGQQYYSQPIPSIPGYALDLDKLPDNGAGLYSDEPIEVVYYFKNATGEIKTDDKDAACTANVIYMANDGKILDVKTHRGAEGDMVQVEHLAFDGYTFHGKSDNYAAYSSAETNVIVNYKQNVFDPKPYIIIGGVALLLIAAIAFFFIGRNKRRKMESLEVDES